MSACHDRAISLRQLTPPEVDDLTIVIASGNRDEHTLAVLSEIAKQFDCSSKFGINEIEFCSNIDKH